MNLLFPLIQALAVYAAVAVAPAPPSSVELQWGMIGMGDTTSAAETISVQGSIQMVDFSRSVGASSSIATVYDTLSPSAGQGTAWIVTGS